MVPVFLTAPNLDAPDLIHGFFLRKGGVSQGLQDEGRNDLAVGFQEGLDPEQVLENRRRVSAEIAMPLHTVHQVHGANVLTVEGPDTSSPGEEKEADGLVTKTPGVALGIVTADCAPILLADLDAGVIGACHAGWRGLKAGIIDRTLAAMVALGAHRGRMVAAIGPCLSRLSYEVSLDFPENFAGVLDHHRSFFRPGLHRDKLMFDLPRAARVLLENQGIRRAHGVDRDTLTERENFFSHRRATLAGEPSLGRQISLIGLK